MSGLKKIDDAQELAKKRQQCAALADVPHRYTELKGNECSE
jgi:hypothetical protein